MPVIKLSSLLEEHYQFVVQVGDSELVNGPFRTVAHARAFCTTSYKHRSKEWRLTNIKILVISLNKQIESELKPNK